MFGKATRRRILALTAMFLAAASVALGPVRAEASALRPLQVTFTFDDGVTDQMQAKTLLEKYGMVGTFYINSANHRTCLDI